MISIIVALVLIGAGVGSWRWVRTRRVNSTVKAYAIAFLNGDVAGMDQAEVLLQRWGFGPIEVEFSDE